MALVYIFNLEKPPNTSVCSASGYHFPAVGFQQTSYTTHASHKLIMVDLKSKWSTNKNEKLNFIDVMTPN